MLHKPVLARILFSRHAFTRPWGLRSPSMAPTSLKREYGLAQHDLIYVIANHQDRECHESIGDPDYGSISI